VGIQAGAADIEGTGDVADTRRRVAALVEEGAGDVFDRLPAWSGLDDHASLPT